MLKLMLGATVATVIGAITTLVVGGPTKLRTIMMHSNDQARCMVFINTRGRGDMLTIYIGPEFP